MDVTGADSVAAVVTTVTDSIAANSSTSEGMSYQGYQGFISSTEKRPVDTINEASEYVPISTAIQPTHVSELPTVAEHTPTIDEIEPVAPSVIEGISPVVDTQQVPATTPQDPLLAILASIQQQLNAIQNAEERASPARPPPPPPRRSRFWSKSMRSVKETDSQKEKEDFKIPHIDINMEGYFVRLSLAFVMRRADL